MAEKDPETGPSLELPSLFGRRKRRTEQSGDTTTVPRTQAPGDQGDTTTVTRAEPPQPAPDTTAVIPVVEDPAPPAAPPAPTRAARPVAPRPTPAAVTPARPAGGRRRARSGSRTIPSVAASTAAFVVGAVVGLLGCLLTYLGLQGCELLTGTDSCGGPGLLVLVVILVVMVLVGAAMLKALGVADAGNVSFLGVGVLTVVALLFLIDYLYDPWMFVVVPAVTAVSFALARWVTTLYAEDVLDDDNGMPHHDIR